MKIQTRHMEIQTRHTPKPWRTHRVEVAGGGVKTAIVADDKIVPIAIMANEYLAIRVADARMIISAPDLLAALKDCLSTLTTDAARRAVCNTYGEANWTPIVEAARAAIAKAEGNAMESECAV